MDTRLSRTLTAVLLSATVVGGWPGAAALAAPLRQEAQPAPPATEEAPPAEGMPDAGEMTEPEAPALAAPVVPLSGLLPGTPVLLKGTPHLWIADEQGALHWVGDTSALVGVPVAWEQRREVTFSELKAFPLASPLVSAGLVKDGDPIYLVKWEARERLPRLLQVLSIGDVELFGLNAENYGALLFNRPAWEQASGISLDRLRRGVLVPVQSGVPPLAGLLRPEERESFYDSALGSVPGGTIVKWLDTVNVEVRGTPGAEDVAALDGALAELRDALAPLPIRRVTSGGNLIVYFVRQAEASRATAGAVASADGAAALTASSGTLTKCETVVGTDVSASQRQLIVRHGLAHCFGLGHNRRPESVLNASLTHQSGPAGQTASTVGSTYSAIDRVLLRTLYHANVEPDMNREQLARLFG